MKLEIRDGASIDPVLINAIERGIDDVEQGHELESTEAKKKVLEILERRRKMTA